MHGSPSVQGALLFAWTQPESGSQPSSVQGLLSSQLSTAPPTQAPPLHVSTVVQAFPSLQAAALFVWTQPVAGMQLSSVHALLSLQLNVPVPAWQLPPEQRSPVVQAFPSLHDAVLLV